VSFYEPVKLDNHRNVGTTKASAAAVMKYAGLKDMCFGVSCLVVDMVVYVTP